MLHNQTLVRYRSEMSGIVSIRTRKPAQASERVSTEWNPGAASVRNFLAQDLRAAPEWLSGFGNGP